MLGQTASHHRILEKLGAVLAMWTDADADLPAMKTARQEYTALK